MINFKKAPLQNRNFLFYIVLITLLISISIGLLFNFKLPNYTINYKEELLNEKEKSFLITLQNTSPEEMASIEKIILKEISILENSTLNSQITLNLGKAYFFLGYLNELKGDNLSAKDNFITSIKHLEVSQNYFYLLNSRFELLNIHYNLFEYGEALVQASEIYISLKSNEIKGISEEGLLRMSIDVLSGIIMISSRFGMVDISDYFYEDLLFLTETSTSEKTFISEYAKYQYNFYTNKFEEAEKNANNYLELALESEDPNNLYFSNILRLQLAIKTSDFVEIEDLFRIIYKDLYLLENPKIAKGYLYNLAGQYCVLIENYQEGFEYFDTALNLFEEMNIYFYATIVNNSIIDLHNKFTFDIHYYLNLQKEYENYFSYEEEVSNLASSLISLSLKHQTIKEKEKSEVLSNSHNINKTSGVFNIIFLFIILSLGVITRILNKEVSIRKNKETELNYIINHDYLTKCYTKQYIHTKLNSLFKSGDEFLLCLIDIDDFKNINDTYGHIFGDIVLKTLVSTLSNIIEDKGIIGRFGGEEFIIILNNDVNPFEISEEICSAIREITWNKDDFNTTVSGGIVRSNGECIVPLIKRADKLLYQAKESGKDKIIVKF